MRLWALLAVLLLSSLVLAGCSDDGDDDDGDATSSSSTTTRRSSSSGSSMGGTSTSAGTTSSQPGQPAQEPSNTAPVGSMAVSPVPNVSKAYNFTLNGTDPEGDNLVWDLLYGDGQSTSGAVLPAAANHSYAAVGLYNATFTVSDGRLQTTYNLTVNVTAAAAGPGLTFVASVAASFSQCAAVMIAVAGGPAPATPLPSASWGSQEQGVDAIWTEVGPERIGLPFVASYNAVDIGVGMLSSCDPTAAAAIALFD